MVPGEANTNLIFDCVVPYDTPLQEDEVRQAICKKVSERHPGYTCVIDIDRSFVQVDDD